MAPTALTSSGLPTATGLLIRDNINRAEDRMAGAEEALKRLENEVFEGENPSFSQLVASPRLEGRMESASTALVGRERLFLEESINGSIGSNLRSARTVSGNFAASTLG
jgi:hypothetical protein